MYKRTTWTSRRRSTLRVPRLSTVTPPHSIYWRVIKFEVTRNSFQFAGSDSKIVFSCELHVESKVNIDSLYPFKQRQRHFWPRFRFQKGFGGRSHRHASLPAGAQQGQSRVQRLPGVEGRVRETLPRNPLCCDVIQCGRRATYSVGAKFNDAYTYSKACEAR